MPLVRLGCQPRDYLGIGRFLKGILLFRQLLIKKVNERVDIPLLDIEPGQKPVLIAILLRSTDSPTRILKRSAQQRREVFRAKQILQGCTRLQQGLGWRVVLSVGRSQRLIAHRLDDFRTDTRIPGRDRVLRIGKYREELPGQKLELTDRE